MEFDLFSLSIVGGVVSLASTWLTFKEDFLYYHRSNLPLAKFIFCNLWQTSIAWLSQTQLSHLRRARHLFEMCPTLSHISYFKWGFLGVKFLLELRELFFTIKVVASSNNVLPLYIPYCFFILEDETMSFVDGRKWIHDRICYQTTTQVLLSLIRTFMVFWLYWNYKTS